MIRLGRTAFALGLNLALGLGLAMPAAAQIAPECQGVQPPANYDEDFQQAFLANYFAAAFLMTPMGPPITGDEANARLTLELGFIPPLSCERRLVLNGTKTEDTNLLPVSPRPRLFAQLPSLGGLKLTLGGTFVPPVPTPIGTILQVGVDVMAAYRFGPVDLGLRGHLNFARARAEIATPFNEGDPAVDDLFYANVMAAELVGSYHFEGVDWLVPYASLGMGDVSTMFLIGDDRIIVDNVVYPWWGVTASLGARAVLFDHLDLVVEASSAIPLYYTAKAAIGVTW